MPIIAALVIAALVIAAVVVVLLVVRGAGEANEKAEQQERELEREMADAAAWERITR